MITDTRIELVYPFEEFPKTEEEWELCRKQMKDALQIISDLLVFGRTEEGRKAHFAFLESITKRTNPTRSITVEEFRKLRTTADAVEELFDPSSIFGRFSIGKGIQENQIKKAKVGDSVFFMEIMDKGLNEEGGISIHAEVVQATLVE